MNINDQKSVEGFILDPNFTPNWGANVKVTSTTNINEQQLFEKIIAELTSIEKKQFISSTEISAILEQIHLLPEKSELRLQCEFHYRNIKKRIPEEQNHKKNIKDQNVESNMDIVTMLKQATDIKELESYFLQKKWPSFINIGSQARKEILNQLIRKKSELSNENQIIHFVKEETHKIKGLLEQISTIKNEVTLLEHLNRLHLKWFQNQTRQTKELIVELLVKRTIPANLTITTLDELLQNVLKEVNHLSTIPFELLNSRNELNDSL